MTMPDVFAVILQAIVVVYIIIDAFQPGRLALQKCPHYYNDKHCSTAWKISTILSLIYFIEAIILAVTLAIIHQICRQRRNHGGDQSCISTLCEILVTTMMKVVVYMFTWILVLWSINVTTPSIVLTATGGFILPIIVAIYDIVFKVLDTHTAGQ